MERGKFHEYARCMQSMRTGEHDGSFAFKYGAGPWIFHCLAPNAFNCPSSTSAGSRLGAGGEAST